MDCNYTFPIDLAPNGIAFGALNLSGKVQLQSKFCLNHQDSEKSSVLLAEISFLLLAYKAFRHVETLSVQGRNLVPTRLAIGWRGLFTFCQPIASLLGTRFLPWMSKVSTCRKAL